MTGQNRALWQLAISHSVLRSGRAEDFGRVTAVDVACGCMYVWLDVALIVGAVTEDAARLV